MQLLSKFTVWLLPHKQIEGGREYFALQQAKHAGSFLKYAVIAVLFFSYFEYTYFNHYITLTWTVPLVISQLVCMYLADAYYKKQQPIYMHLFYVLEVVAILMWLGYLYIFGWHGASNLEIIWRAFVVFVVTTFYLGVMQYSMLFLITNSTITSLGIILYIAVFSDLPTEYTIKYVPVLILGWFLMVKFGRSGYELKCQNYLIMTQNKRLVEQLDDMLVHDELTKVHNRRHFNNELSRYFDLYQRYGHPFSLAILDIDFFKRINDTYGHDAGDKVLVELSQYINSSLRSTDVCARYGGEEFVLILPKQNLEVAEEVMEKLRQSIAELDFEYEGKPLSLTVSIGVTTITEQDTEDTLIRKADDALYRAKEAGRNRVELG